MQRRIYRRYRLTKRERQEHTHVQGRAWTYGPRHDSHPAAVRFARQVVAAEDKPHETRVVRRPSGEFQVKSREVKV